MKYAALNGNAVAAMQYDALAIPALSRVCGRFLPWTNSSLRPAAIQVVLNDITLNRRRTVLELGSGLSTLFIATLLAESGGHLVTVDHDLRWTAQVRGWLAPAADAVTTFVHAPLRKRSYEDEEVDWYAPDAIAAALRGLPRVDLLVVDGPPADYRAGCVARGPALDVVGPFLADAATIILGDINRAGEQRIAGRWSEALRHPYRDLTVEAGIALWCLGEAHNISQ